MDVRKWLQQRIATIGFRFMGIWLVLCWVLPAHGQQWDKNGLDRYFDSLEANRKFMGSVAVLHKGQLIYSRSAGFADVPNNIEATANTKYRIGSITKTFTAVLALKLAEEGAISLGDTLGKWFPGLYKGISVAHLLGHRSGIANFTDRPDYLNWHTQPQTEKALLELISQGGIVFEADCRAGYSNSNYILLTSILQRVTQKSYAELLQNYIVKPLGLKNTYWGRAIEPNTGECFSYRMLAGWTKEPETHHSIPLGAGGVVSTPSDLVLFSDALFGGRLLTTASMEQMKTIRFQMGMGLMPIPFYERKGFGHTGGLDGFSSVLVCFPSDELSYALTSNGVNYPINLISVAVLSAVFQKPFEIPSFAVYEVSPDLLDAYVGEYVSLQLPLKIVVSRLENVLMAQATGQSAFPLEPFVKDGFRFDAAGVVMEFDPIQHTLILKQNGMVFAFRRE